MLHTETKKGNELQIIFIHGNSSSAASWKNVFAEKSLSAYTLVALDLPGYGGSPRSNTPEKDYTLQALATPVDQYLAGVRAPYILVGLSLGANIVGELQNASNNCRGIVLASPSIIGKKLQVSDIIMPNPNVSPLFMETAEESALNAFVADSAFNIPDETKEKIKQDYLRTDPKLRSALAASIGAGGFCDELSHIEKRNIPVAVLFGSEEKICFKDYLDKTDLKKWRNKTHHIANGGHFLQWDQPAALGNIIADFAKEAFAMLASS